MVQLLRGDAGAGRGVDRPLRVEQLVVLGSLPAVRGPRRLRIGGDQRMGHPGGFRLTASARTGSFSTTRRIGYWPRSSGPGGYVATLNFFACALTRHVPT
jgi:hypothetical protein